MNLKLLKKMNLLIIIIIILVKILVMIINNKYPKTLKIIAKIILKKWYLKESNIIRNLL